MSAAKELDAARHLWVASAQERLAWITEAVGLLRKAFEVTTEEELEPTDDPSERIVAACNALASWLAESKAPKGLGKAEGELAAVAGVYRNAAYAFRNVADADDEARTARMAAGATMLQQGDHHVEAFGAIIARKVNIGGSPPRSK
jgi:hypothetical protein